MLSNFDSNTDSKYESSFYKNTALCFQGLLISISFLSRGFGAGSTGREGRGLLPFLSLLRPLCEAPSRIFVGA